jgi:hypothetical protein
MSNSEHNPLPRLGVVVRSGGGVTINTADRDWGPPPQFDPPTEPGLYALERGWAVVVWLEDGQLNATPLNPDELAAMRAYCEQRGTFRGTN